jgi:hypothetical protein
LANQAVQLSSAQKITLFLTGLLCYLSQILPVIRSGLTYSFGIGYWGPNGHDGIWHLSLINNISNPLAIKLPMFSGATLTNYHPFFDILLSLFHRLTHLPSSLLLFQIFPLLSGLIFVSLSYRIGYKITQNFTGGILLMIVNSLGTSLGWIPSLLRSHQLGGESLFWSMQSVSNQLNPPFILSLLIILYLIFSLLYHSRPNLFAFLLISLLPITKVYGAFAAYIFLFFYILLKRQWSLFKYFSISVVLGLILFFYFNPHPSSLLTFQPFWFINSMIDSLDRLYLPFLTRVRTSSTASFFLLRLLFVQSIGLIIFTLGNFAWRLLFVVKLKSITAKPLLFSLLLASLILFLIPLLFIQKGTSWNTIQFLYYSLFFTNFLFAFSLASLRLPSPALLLLLALVIFPNLESYRNYLGNPPPAYLDPKEISALQFLSQQKKGIVLAYPYDQYLKASIPRTPIPLYAYETTSYLSAYSRQTVFLEDEMNLQNSGYDQLSRRQQSLRFFEQKNIFEDRGFLLNNQIDYVYLVGLQIPKVNLNYGDLFLREIFNNGYVKIYQVIK